MTADTPSRFASRPAKRLTIWLGVRDRHRHTSLEVELLRRARKSKLAGATVFEGQMGYGADGRLHRAHVFAGDQPLAIVVVDDGNRIDAFLDDLAQTVHGIVATVDDVEIVDL